MSLTDQIIMFDMDGTLTPARKEIESNMVIALKKLSKYAHIVILTGSDYDYVEQQCERLFEINGVDPTKIDILPCNGTKVYKYEESLQNYELKSSNDMMEVLGESYQKLIRKLIALQNKYVNISYAGILSLSGTFLQYRESLLNWCMIGRNANNELRQKFELFDSMYLHRELAKNELDEFILHHDLAVETALGGSTSIDIFPTGWNKTYALNHYEKDRCWFVGDRCEKGGNDFAIYSFLDKESRSYVTDGPSKTIEIIEEIIQTITS